jgi:hypothetical protein
MTTMTTIERKRRITHRNPPPGGLFPIRSGAKRFPSASQLGSCAASAK